VDIVCPALKVDPRCVSRVPPQTVQVRCFLAGDGSIAMARTSITISVARRSLNTQRYHVDL
jgi:hypothetical protein